MSVRLFSAKTSRFARPYRMGAGVVVALIVVYALLPRPPQPQPPRPLGLEEGRRLVASLTLPEPQELRADQMALAKFGRQLYYDRRLSADGMTACSDCHDQSQARDKTMQAPPLVNLDEQTWFFSDGRQDNLLGSVLYSIEHKMMNSRLNVTRLMALSYGASYATHFGEVAIDPAWPEHALPAAKAEVSLPLDIASEALATLTSLPLLESILTTARESHQAPVTEMTRRAINIPPADPERVAAFAALPEEQREKVDTVFIRAGLAIATYLKTRRSAPSAFDEFAKALLSGQTLAQSFRSDFDQQHWRGLTLFTRDDSCIRCHYGPRLRNDQFHNIGLSARGEELRLGRTAGLVHLQNSEFTCSDPRLKFFVKDLPACRQTPFLSLDKQQQLGAFATPSLRHLPQSAPYFHDGRAQTLDEVLKHYSLQTSRPAVGWRSSLLAPHNFTPEEHADLQAFLRSLDSPMTELGGQPIGLTLSQSE